MSPNWVIQSLSDVVIPGGWLHPGTPLPSNEKHTVLATGGLHDPVDSFIWQHLVCCWDPGGILIVSGGGKRTSQGWIFVFLFTIKEGGIFLSSQVCGR